MAAIRYILIMICLACCLVMGAQRPLLVGGYANPNGLPLGHHHPDPDPPQPVPPSVFDDVESGVAYTEVPAAPDTLFGTIPFDVVHEVNGRMRLSIPIASFSSGHESEPGVSLTYDNTMLIGPMGYGWRIDGVPVIERCGRNFFTDGNTSGAALDEAVFSLDGVRLLYQRHTPAGTEFRTQTGNTRAVLGYGGHFWYTILQKQ
ncbi:MAG: hypothetical protein IKR25_02395 [Muribaculaceae bacterium]|nr:hypothetical protein [Muribaculaceae bacterium]